MNINAYLQRLGRKAREDTPRARTPWLLLGGSFAAIAYIATDPTPAAGVSAVIFPVLLLISFASLCLTAILRLLTR